MEDKFNGLLQLEYIIKQSSYKSLEKAVASLVIFTHPDTVAQTGTRNIFMTIRNMSERGKDCIHNGITATQDDNKSPTDAFIWAHSMTNRDYKHVQFNHIWAKSDDVNSYTNLANICVLPAFLSKLSDSHANIKCLLQYRAFCLYQWKPKSTITPEKPEGYDLLHWSDTMPVVENIETVYRNVMGTERTDRTIASARRLGWVFSDYKPDGSL